MCELAKSLLSQYYGINGDWQTKESLSIHECLKLVDEVTENLSTQRLSLKSDEELGSKATDSEVSNVDSDKRNSLDEVYLRSSRALETDAEDEDKNLEDLDLPLGSNSLLNVPENAKLSKISLVDMLKASPKPIVIEEPTVNDLSAAVIDDCMQNNDLDVAPVVMQKKASKKTKKTSAAKLPPLPKKSPVYNEKFIDMTNCDIIVFPVDLLDKLSGLRMLYLENNSLTELPDNLFPALQHLEWLDVRRNCLKTLPSSVKSHPCLETILLQYNQIERLPLELCFLPRLKSLFVTDNPLILPPEDVVASGFSDILTFLRNEWNSIHPDDPVQPVEVNEVELKLSNSLCYEEPVPIRKKKSSIVNELHPNNQNAVRRMSVRERGRSYKPSNRCDNVEVNDSADQQLFWLTQIKEMLNKQASILQKFKDDAVRRKWRQDNQSLNKSLENAANRSEDGIPYAVDINDFPLMVPRKEPLKKMLGSSKKDLRNLSSVIDLNKKISELSTSLDELNLTCRDPLTPKTRQESLSRKIEEILLLQGEIEYLRQHNDTM